MGKLRMYETQEQYLNDPIIRTYPTVSYVVETGDVLIKKNNLVLLAHIMLQV